jgi:hypothetical protein
MKKVLILLFVCVFLGTVAFAAGPKEYQVTGPVLEIKDDVIVVEKGPKDKWEIAKDKVTKVEGGELKVGVKVTIYYTMKASTIEVKGEKKAEPKAETKKEAPKKQ